MTKRAPLVAQFGRSVERLREVLSLEKQDFVRDSAILRFEIALDLSWKALRTYLLEVHGVRCFSPKSCIREAYRIGVLEYQDAWLDYIDMRNIAVHTYNENVAEDVYRKLPAALRCFEELYSRLQSP
ncbi:MAG: nucleotidyltransferase substrate binding protein [Ignavibacteriae bacterium]|nr:nucleotidyltransferase substrate binding protein [Ignavibacteriota bacterium]